MRERPLPLQTSIRGDFLPSAISGRDVFIVQHTCIFSRIPCPPCINQRNKIRNIGDARPRSFLRRSPSNLDFGICSLHPQQLTRHSQPAMPTAFFLSSQLKRSATIMFPVTHRRLYVAMCQHFIVRKNTYSAAAGRKMKKSPITNLPHHDEIQC